MYRISISLEKLRSQYQTKIKKTPFIKNQFSFYFLNILRRIALIFFIE